MDIAVLGNSARYLAPLGAGTSYLVRTAQTTILLDCGNGTHRQLAHELGEARPDAVVVSHFHLDNVADLLPVVFALPADTPVLVPDGARPRIGDMLRAHTMDASWLAHARLESARPAATRRVGDITLSWTRADHGCPGVVTRLAADSGASLVYLGDTGPRPWLAPFAAGVGMVLAHTLLLDREMGAPRATNLTAGDAGRLARDAGAHSLALSHIPFYSSPEASLAEAKAAFGGEVRVLREGQRVPVPLGNDSQ